MSTIKEVAALAGVAVGTVSNYVTGAKNVSSQTAKTIQRAIDELDYHPNSYAKNLRANNNMEIGVILPNIYDQYYSFILAGLEGELRQAGYYLNIAISDDVPEEETAILDAFMKKDMRGLIVVSCQNNGRYFENFSHTHTVFIDRRVTQSESNFITFDAYETISYLLAELEKEGYRDVALFAGPLRFSCEADCARAFQSFYRERGLEAPEEYICHLRTIKEEAFRVGMEFFQNNKPDAVISTSRNITNGLEQALLLCGVSTNEDIRIVSFGQENWSRSVTSNGILHTMRPAHLLGKKAARILIDNINSPLMFEKQQIILHDKIIGKPLFAQPSFHINRREKTDTLKILMLESHNAEAALQTQPDFTRKTGMNAEITLCEHGAMLDTILKEAENPNGYDVVMYDNPWLDILVDGGALQDISDITEREDFDKDVFLPGLMDKVGVVNGRVYGVPFLFGSQLMLYRKDLFENPQIQEQFEKRYRTRLRVPRTWFEFNVVSKFFTHRFNPGSPVQYGTSIAAGSTAFLLPELMPRLWSYGSGVFDSDGRAGTGAPAFAKGLSNFIETFDYADPKARSCTVEQTVTDFYNGQTAMLVGFTSFMADVNNEKKSSVLGRVGYANIPGGCSVLGGWGLGVPKGCVRRESALSFIRWICDPSLGNYFAILNGQSPMRQAYLNDELANHYPWLPIIYRSYETNRQRRSMRRPDGTLVPITEVERLIFKCVSDILQNNCSAADGIKHLTARINELIER